MFRVPIHDQAANESALDLLCTALDTKRVFGVAGAGLSNWAGYDTWDAVLGRLADAVTAATGSPDVAADIRRFDINNKLFQAQKLGDRLGEAAFQEFLRQEFALPTKPLHNVLKDFAALPIPHILTLNFDRSCELAHDAIGRPYRVLSTADRQSQLTFLNECSLPYCLKTIFHLHGVFTDPITSIALRYERYRALYGNGLLPKFLWSIYTARPLLFVGFSFSDQYYCRELQTCADDVRECLGFDTPNRHFAILQVPFGNDHDERVIRRTMRNSFLVETIFYETRDSHDPLEKHAGFAELIHEIAERLNVYPPGIGDPVASAAPPPPPLSDADEVRRIRLLGQVLERLDGERDQ